MNKALTLPHKLLNFYFYRVHPEQLSSSSSLQADQHYSLSLAHIDRFDLLTTTGLSFHPKLNKRIRPVAVSKSTLV